MSIEVKNLSHIYLKKTPNATKALDDISLCFDGHFFTAIIGETGSGKSTLIQHLNGLIIPQSGQVVVDGLLVNKKTKGKDSKNLKKHVGLVFQFAENQLFEDTVENDAAFGPKNFGLSKEQALEEAHKALRLVGVNESFYKRNPIELSGGEKRKVALAGILALNPDILVLDEPIAGLDNKSQKEFLELIKKLYESGKSIILVCHDMDVVLEYCNQVVCLENGKVSFIGAPFDLFDGSHNVSLPFVSQVLLSLKEKDIVLKENNIKNVKELAEAILDWRKSHE